MQSEISVFNYQNSHQFLLDQVKVMQSNDPALSVRGLAGRMGMKSHALLLMLLQKKRPLRVKHALPLSKGLGLSSQERLYFQALIQLDNAGDLEEKHLCNLWLSELHPTQPKKVREIEDYELVSNWLYSAILALSETADVDLSPEGIAQRFSKKTNVAEVRSAISRLLSNGLIEFLDETRFKPTYQYISTADDVASEGAKKYHRTVLGFAEQALMQVPLEKREFQSFAMTIPEDKIFLAKEMIRKFRTQFLNAMGETSGREVYQFNTQFFQLSESLAGASQAKSEEAVPEVTIPMTTRSFT